MKLRQAPFAALAILALILPTPTPGVEFGAGLHNTQWSLYGDVFGCFITQPIPRYGNAVFYHEAGEDVRFYLETTNNRMQPGRAALTIEAPVWRSSALTNDLGYVSVTNTDRPLNVEATRTLRMLAELEAGMAPAFTRQGRGMDEPVRVKLSPVNFGRQWEDYQTCVADLLPVNFRQIERSRIQYEPDIFTIDDEGRTVLNNIAMYVNADPSVVAIYIEGHSDNRNTRFDSRRLSERRALTVQDYLIEQGVDPQLLLVDFHGDRYPIGDNATAAGRAENRRTTLRLERLP
ncbi:OmpA family protein [Salinispirillum marinum]|uniref:OmpA family protein n=2 Tax=Saccharospirillaceae TaxID=255527 RepID=A0ABV8BKZ2_9GAMM